MVTFGETCLGLVVGPNRDPSYLKSTVKACGGVMVRCLDVLISMLPVSGLYLSFIYTWRGSLGMVLSWLHVHLHFYVACLNPDIIQMPDALNDQV